MKWKVGDKCWIKWDGQPVHCLLLEKGYLAARIWRLRGIKNAKFAVFVTENLLHKTREAAMIQKQSTNGMESRR
jgi:hypothetical protein